MGSSGCEGRLERPPSVQEIVIMQWIVKKIINKFIVNKILTSKQHLDQGDGEVVRGGVEPLDRGYHAAVVHCAQELRLEKYFSKKTSEQNKMKRNGRENEEEVKEITWSIH